jgi:polysaccharide export outer membrane protein
MNYRFAVFLPLGLLLTGSACEAQRSATQPMLSPAPVASKPADATAPAGSMLAMTPPDSATYIIGPDDALTVTVWKEPTLSNGLTVRPDGMITLPLLGDVQASGLTPMKLAADLTTKLKKFITDPLVTVTVNGVNSKRVYMVGEVGHIGPLQIMPGMTILQAIASAGGLTPYANAHHIYILRTDKGKQLKIPFDYKKAVKNGDLQGITLVPGDTIVVP